MKRFYFGKKNKRRNPAVVLNTGNKGLTIVELIVVITIIVIAAGLTTLSVIKWQDWSYFKKQNEYAQALFSAASNQLTEYAGNGYLTEFANSLVKKNAKPTDNGTDYYDEDDYLVPVREVSKLTDAEGDPYSGEEAVWRSLDESGKGDFGTDIVILKAKAGDIGKVKTLEQAGTDSDKLQAYWIDRLLGSYVSDREVLDGATISIEIAPEDGQVFALLYSDRTNDFKYDADTAQNTAYYNAANRNESYRSSFMVGYYGVDTLSKAIKGQAAADILKIKKVRLINDEALHLAFYHANESIEPFNTNYEIKVYDAEKTGDNLELTLNLKFPSLGTSMGLSPEDSEKLLKRISESTGLSDAVSIMIPVTRHTVAKNGDSQYYSPEGDDLGSLPFLIWMDGKTVHLVLDAADVQATSWLYEQNYKDIYSEDTARYEKADNSFKDTYSFFRFGQCADNIKCSVKATAMTYEDTVHVYSNTENPVFYEEKYSLLGFDTGYIKKTHKSGEQSYTYKLRNPRHFYNMRFTEDPDVITTQDVDSYLDGDRKLSFDLDCDIDWKEFTQASAFKSSKPIVNVSGVDVTDCDFPSFKTLRTRDSFDGSKKIDPMTSKVEESCKLTNFSISKDSNELFYVNYTQEKEGEDFKKVDEPATGLFLVNQGSIKNLTIDDSEVEGETCVGAFAGINLTSAGSEMENLILENTSGTTKVTGIKNVGGIMGFELPVESSVSSDPTVIRDLHNRGAVSGEMAVGGILGMSRNSFTTGVPSALKQYISTDEWSGDGKKIEIRDCTNEGIVSGVVPEDMAEGEEKRQYSRYIGGIAGYLYDDRAEDEDVNISVVSCASAPQYESIGDLQDRLYGVYVGGIAGFNRYGAINNCTTDIKNKPRGYVFGYKYVGGIVGMNIGPAEGTAIEGKNSGNIDGIAGEMAVNTNNVVGEYYVGGITGVNAFARNELSDETKESVKKDPEQIEAFTDEAGKPLKLILVPDIGRNLGVSVRDWTNKGVVVAIKEYAGGITGYNTGWIYNCNSDIDPDVANAVFEQISESRYTGDYVGGISGLNNGIIGTTDRYTTLAEAGSAENIGKKKGGDGPTLRAAVYVTGRNFVGGIVGYNAVDALVENYEVSGGHVLADPDEGYFVGGYAGLNVSMALLMDVEKKVATEVPDGEGGTKSVDIYAARRVCSNPNEITGAYFVGGNVGGNMVNMNSEVFSEITDSEDNWIHGLFETNNFLGQIKGTHAFAGGFVGYNAMFDMARDSFDRIPEVILERMQEEDRNYPEAMTDDAQRRAMLTDKVMLMSDLKHNLLDENGERIITDEDQAESVMYITGDAETAIISSNLGRIASDVCVGGVMGFNDTDTRLYIRNAKNATPVVARYTIENKEEQYIKENGEKKYRVKDYAGEDYTYRYSYAGGILGKVTKNTTIDNCSNAPSGAVTSEGTYRGAMAEINEGLVINCEVSNFGSAAYEYVGGLVGLNDYDPEDDSYGIIRNCTLDTKTITGKNMVGGLAAENRGRIYSVAINKPEIVSGFVNRKGFGQGEDKYGVAGVYAAVNCDVGRIYTPQEIKDINVRSEGGCAGGITGINMGLIAPDNETIKEETGLYVAADNPVIITGSVKGYKNAGGVMGVNRSVIKDSDGKPAEISFFDNKADVTATNGNAGGIVGDNAAVAVISYCMNEGVVTASNEGNAGGITSLNKSAIRYCVNIGEVKANEGYAGGIAAVNESDKTGDDDIVTDDEPSTLSGKIEYCGVYSPKFFKDEKKDDYSIGDMFYEDDEYNESNYALDVPEDYELLAFEAEKYAGGVVAVNYSDIEDCEVRYVEVSNTKNSKKDSAAGLFAAINKKDGEKIGSISLATGQSTEGTVVYTRVNRAAMGGVTGINEGTIDGSYGPTGVPTSIIYVKEYLDEASLANFGGVAGVNQGTISGVGVKGIIKGEMGDADIGHGGVVGVNGYVDKDKAGDKKTVASIDYCSFDGTLNARGTGSAIARIGGIAGINGYKGAISHSSIGVLDDRLNLDRETGKQSLTKIYGGNIEDDHGELIPDVTKPQNANVPELATALITSPSDTVSYTYLGGIAGENRGSITECDNFPVSKDRVELSAFTSIAGGIAGYVFEDGILAGTKTTHTTTGDDWVLETHGSDNLSGIGGIMGVTSSAKNPEYLDNYTDVICRVNGHSPAGGLVGYVNQKTNLQYTVKNCRNFGDVLCSYRAAGMCTDVTYNNVSYEDCINYGLIRSITGGAAGFTQYVATAGSECYVDGCFNHGDIIAVSSGSGFYDMYAKGVDNGFGTYMTDCVNTGNLYQVKGVGANDTFLATSPKMFAFSAGTSLYCDNCRDYSNCNAFSYSDKTKNLTNSLGHRFYPEAGSAGYPSSLLPIAQKATGDYVYNNYYIDDGDAFASESGVYFSFAADSAVSNGRISDKASDYFEPVTGDVVNKFHTEKGTSGKPFTFEIDVDYGSDHAEIEDFVIYLFNNDANNASVKKTYDVVADVKASGGDFTVTESGFTASNTLESDRLPLKVSGHGTVEKITLKITPKSDTAVYFRGFEWVDTDGMIHSCDSYDTYLTEKYGVGYGFTSNSEMTWSQRDYPGGNKMKNMLVDGSYDAAFLRDYDRIVANADVFYMSTSAYGYTAQFSFEPTYFRDDAADMDAIAVYVATKDDDASLSGYYHSYSAVFTDEDDNVATVDWTKTDRLKTRSLITIPVPSESDGDENGENKKNMGRITGVTVYLKNHGNNVNGREAMVRVNGFGWIPEGKDEVVKLPYYDASQAEGVNKKTKLIKLVKTVQGAPKGDITLVPERSKPDYDKGIKLVKSDPLSDAYVADKSRYDRDYDDTSIEPGWWDRSERISFFKEFDPKFEEGLFGNEETVYKKLPAPSWFAKENKNGRYKFSWNKIDGAAAYDVRISLVSTETGSPIVRGSTDIMRVSGAMREKKDGRETIFTYFDIEEINALVPEWNEEWGARSLKLEVRAISPYHLSHENASDAGQYDSDWGSYIWKASDVLPQPVYHFEYTGKNTVVAVLENPEDFVGYEDVLKHIKVDFDRKMVANYQDPVANKLQNGVSTVYIILEGGRYTSAPFELNIANGSYQDNNFTKAVAISKSDEVADSEPFQTSGTFLFTPEHMGPQYIYGARFAGFSGTTANDLKYYIEVRVMETDFYINGDLLSLDEELGLPVAYSHGVLHTANRHLKQYTYFTIGLGDLPEDLVERDFGVRTYVYASQDNMLHMGHYVAEGVKFDSLSDVQALTDEKYINGADGSVVPQSVCDGSELRPGYVLWKKPDGTFDVYYSSSLECEERQPDKAAGKITEDSNYQIKSIEYKYCDYEDASTELQEKAGGYDLYTTTDVSYREEKTESSKKVTRRYYIDSNKNPEISPMTYDITITGAKYNSPDGNIVIRYKEGSYYVTDAEGNPYGKEKAYNNKIVHVGDEMNYNNSLNFTSGASATGNTVNNGLSQSATVKHEKDPGNSYDFMFQPNNVIVDPAGKTHNIDFRVYRGYLEFTYTYDSSLSSDPFEFDVKMYNEDIQRVQPAPTISKNYIKRTENGHNVFTFFWDQDALEEDPLYENSVYNVRLYGDTVSQDMVPIAEVNGISERQCDFTDSQDNWNYKNLRLHVTRVGTENKYNRTYILPHTEVRDEFKVMLRLDTVSIISADLNMDAEERFITDDLDYKVVWDQITDPYQLQDLAGYVIKIVDRKDENGDPVTEPKIHYYPVKVNETPVFDKEDGSVTYDPLESGVNPDNSSQYYAIINLSDFDGGHILGYTVQPIAKTAAEVYSDGMESNVFEKLLSTRLNTPIISSDETADDHIKADDTVMTSFEASDYDREVTDISGTSYHIEYQNSVSYETYEKGLTINMTNAGNYQAEGADTVTLNVAAAVFDECTDASVTGEGSDKDRHFAGDMTDEALDGYWNSGAVKTLLTKEAPGVMAGKADAASYNLKLTDYETYPGEFAGKWIKLAFMASKTNNISSSWTDEDLLERDTVNYYWFHVPELVLDDVVLGDSLTLSNPYPVNPNVRYFDGSTLYDSRQSDSNTVFEQVAIGFKADLNAAGYAFDIKQTSKLSGGSTVTPVYGVFLCRNRDKGGMDVYIKALKDAALDADHDLEVGDKYEGDDEHEIPACSIESDAVWVGYFDDDETGEQKLTIEDITHEWTGSNLKFKAYMTYEAGDKDAAVRLVLPDLQRADSQANIINYIATDSVLIQTKCLDSDAYHPGRHVVWYRVTEADRYNGQSAFAYMTHDEAKRWFTEKSLFDENEAEEHLLGGEEDTVSENEISAEIEDVSDVEEEVASGVETEAETEDHEDKASDIEHDSEKPSESTDVQKDEDDSSSKKEDSSTKKEDSSTKKEDSSTKKEDSSTKKEEEPSKSEDSSSKKDESGKEDPSA